MKTSMAHSNVAIINDLKNFLEEISSDSSKRILYSSSFQAFSRKRLLCFQTIVLLIANTLKRSLSIELGSFFEGLSSHKICSKQAFSKGRQKLKPLFFHHWNDRLVCSYYHHHQSVYHRWKKFKLLAIDGSCLALPDTEALRDKYGCASNHKGDFSPTCRVSILYDVLNQVIVKGVLHPYHSSEHTACLTLLEQMDLSDNLLLFDRGYPSYWLFYLLLQRNAHFVFRASFNMNEQVKRFLESQKKDIELNLYPSYKSIKRLKQMHILVSKYTAVKVRLVKVLLNTGETEILITNLYDKRTYPRKVFKELYHFRWGVETCYGYLKEGLQLQQFSGINPICIEQDFAANLFFFNLQSIIEKQCEPFIKEVNKKRKYDYKVNKNVTWAFLKCRVAKLFLEKKPIHILKELGKIFCRYLEPIRPGRKYPRTRKRRPDTKCYTFKNYKRAI